MLGITRLRGRAAKGDNCPTELDTSNMTELVTAAKYVKYLYVIKMTIYVLLRKG